MTTVTGAHRACTALAVAVALFVAGGSASVVTERALAATATMPGTTATATGSATTGDYAGTSTGAETSASDATAPEGAGKPLVLGEGPNPKALPAPPRIAAPAWIVVDASDATALAGRAIGSPRPIASLTKIMTALVVVERTEGDELVTMSRNAVATPGNSSSGARAGERYTVDDLLRAMLVRSANDAAVALAEHVAGTERSFIGLMNERAARLELTDTRFGSVTGLDKDGTNTSTPADIVTLAMVAMRAPRIARSVRLDEFTFPARSGPVVLPNRNPLIGTYDGVDGVKTGMTDAAGWCLLAHYSDTDEQSDGSASSTTTGTDMYTVVLGATTEEQRATETRMLLDWARALRPEVTFAEAAEPIGEAPVAYTDERAHLFVDEHVSARVRLDRNVSERITVPATLERPIREGDEVGRYEALVDGKVVASTAIYVQESFPQMSTRARVEYHLRRADTAWASGWSSVRNGIAQQREYWGL